MDIRVSFGEIGQSKAPIAHPFPDKVYVVQLGILDDLNAMIKQAEDEAFAAACHEPPEWMLRARFA